MLRRIASRSRKIATEKRQATARSLGKPIDTAEAALEVTILRIYRVHNSEYSICPRCETPLEREFVNYCSNCGQRLSWEAYHKGNMKIEYCPSIFQNEVVSAEKSSQEKCLVAK